MSCRLHSSVTLTNIPCIYKIINIKNNKFYIGSCLLFSRRKSFHLFTLRKGIHCNKHLQRSFIKYGEDSFKFEILEYCNKQNLIEKEQYYLDTLKPDYNSRIIANSNLGNKRVFTDEEKNNTRERNKNFRKLSKEDVEKIQNLRESGKTYKEIGKIFDIDNTCILRILKGQYYKEFYRDISVKVKKCKSPNKLSSDNIKEIKEMISLGFKHSVISQKFKVDQSSISRIKTKNTKKE